VTLNARPKPFSIWCIESLSLTWRAVARMRENMSQARPKPQPHRVTTPLELQSLSWVYYRKTESVP
jgi:hypothetical protein